MHDGDRGWAVSAAEICGCVTSIPNCSRQQVVSLTACDIKITPQPRHREIQVIVFAVSIHHGVEYCCHPACLRVTVYSHDKTGGAPSRVLVCTSLLPIAVIVSEHYFRGQESHKKCSSNIFALYIGQCQRLWVAAWVECSP